MGLWQFWIVAAAMALGSGLVIARAYRRGKPVDTDKTAIYRDQLAEVERDLARGTLSGEEAARLRIEVSRRLLDADRAQDALRPAGTGRASRWVLPGVALALAASFGAYLYLGAPGYPDLPLAKRIALSDRLRAERPSQSAAETEAAATPAPPAAAADPEFLELMEKLRATMAARPDDARGMELLARNEAVLGNFTAAKEAQAKLVALRGDQVSAEDQAALAELMIMAAGGYVSPEAEQVLVRALTLDPRNGTARYYSGLMYAQIGRPDQTFRLWRPLLEESPASAPWVAPIRAQLQQIAWAAGVKYELPAAQAPFAGLPGPSAADIDATADMSPEDRQQMIRGMVDGLMARLAAEGGTSDEWARLISSLGVLGDRDRARAIWAEAQGRFATRPEDLAKVRAAAEQAGVAQTGAEQ